VSVNVVNQVPLNAFYLHSDDTWTYRVRNKEVLPTVKDNSILHTIKKRKDNWTGHTMLSKYLLKHASERKIEGRIEGKGRRGRRRKQILDDLKETKRAWKLKQDALDVPLWRTRFGTGLWTFGETEYRMNG